ncbi:chromate efflux transporter [Ahrensia sp. R2A130]|uniref:chromate efflux transporter n=1 Tax=Ahrensia sp. R2A130 TaxID=744979 RepID=UPI0001E0D0AF|nr:chromate efflux transporter [Ahrensia sp. R2A130]EFL90302.1 chromate transporter [Ahrensia sp. R2A130]
MTVPTLREELPVWAKIGFLSFGGPAAQIALMHREVVELRGWMSEKSYLAALSFCMLLPGPEAMQLATYCGWKTNGVKGGLLAGGLFVLPGAILIAVLALLYGAYGQLPFTAALFLGIKAAVLVIVIEALLRVAKRALVSNFHRWLALAAFIALFLFGAPYPLVIVAAALAGWWYGRNDAAEPSVEIRVATSDTIRTAAIWLSIWLIPVAAVSLFAPQVFGDLARFFSLLATVTFGGAYAVLAYMTQEAVTTFGWLTTAEMVDGLGLAETTPGPLILVTEFVGTLAAERAAPDGSNITWALYGAAITLWATFIPCFAWIFVGAPYVEWLSSRSGLRAALSGVTAAVVGVIGSLSMWFAIHVFFATVSPAEGWLRVPRPALETFDWRVGAIAAVAAVLLLKLHRSVLLVLAICAALGVALSGWA